MTEEWKLVPGWPRYKISNHGRVWSTAEDRPMKLVDNYGYPAIRLQDGRTKKSFRTYTLVARAFLGPTPEGKEITHLDGNRANSRVDNLSFRTKEENEADKIVHGTKVFGEKHYASKVTERDVLEMRQLAKSGTSIPALSKKFNLSYTHTHAIIRGIKWKHLPL